MVRMLAIRLADHSERSALLRRARNLASIGTVRVGTAALRCPAERSSAVSGSFPYGAILLVQTSEAGRVREGFPYREILLVPNERSSAEFWKAFRIVRFYWCKRAKLGRVREGFPYHAILWSKRAKLGSSGRLAVPCDFIGLNERSSAEFGKGTASAVP